MKVNRICLFVLLIFSNLHLCSSQEDSLLTVLNFGYSLSKEKQSELLNSCITLEDAMGAIIMNDYKRGKKLLNSINIETLKKRINNDTCITYLNANYLCVLGMYQRELGLLKRAEKTFAEIKISIPPSLLPLVSINEFTLIADQFLANLYQINGNYNKAIELLQQSPNYPGEQPFDLANLAGYFKKAMQLDSAAFYFNELEKSLISRDDPIAKIHLMSEEERNTIVAAYHKLVEYYKDQDLLEKAMNTIVLSRRYILEGDNNSLRKSLRQEGFVHLKKKNYSLALLKFKEALSTTRALFGKRNPHYSSLLERQIGNIHLQLHQLDSALFYYQSAFQTLISEFDPKQIANNPAPQNTEYKKQLLEILGDKTFCLNLRRDPDDAMIAFETSKLAINLLDSIRLGYTEDYDKQFLLQQSYSIFETAIDIAVEMKNYDQAFEWSEKSKAFLLYEAVKNSSAEEYAAILPEDIDQEKALKSRLSKSAVKLRRNNSEKAKKQHFKLKKQLQALIDTFEKKYPKYHQLKYQLDVASPKTIAQELLTPGQSLVEYFVGEQAIYIFLIEQGNPQVQVFKRKKAKEFNDWASTIRDDIYKEDTAAYAMKAYALYQQLFAPLKASGNKRIVIIPDGIMGYIPFNALLTDALALEEQDDFRTFPFMGRSFQLSQCFSASILAQMKAKEQKVQDKKIMAWAPAFKDPNFKGYRSELSILPHAPKEIKAIETIWKNVDALSGPSATKTAFIDSINSKQNSFQVLHIASHAIVNDQEPNYSFIAFSNINSQDDESYKLYVSELYNQQLDFDMVVLSACKTGDGKLFKGEGIISISRAFTYGGARSILTSLWNINDELSFRLMEHFYSALKQGQSKDEALQTAQLKMMKSAQLANPKYWAAFVPIGDMTPLVQEGGSSSLWLAMIGGVLGILLLFLFFRRQGQR